MLTKTFTKLCDFDNELYNMSVNYIKEKLSSLPNNEIYLDPNASPIRVKHYGTLTYNTITRVYLKNGGIYADMDGIDGYEITYAETMDLYKIARAINLIIEK